MIATKSVNCSRKKLDRIELVRPPQAKGYWNGVKHSHLVEAVENTASNRNWKVTEHRIHIWWNDLKIAGCVFLEPEGQEEKKNRMRKAFGFASSNNLDKAIQFYVGGEYSNIPLISDWFKGGKYTPEFDIVSQIEIAFDSWETSIKSTSKHVKEFQQIEVSDNLKNRMILDCGRKKILPWTKIPKMDFEAKQFESKTLWTMCAAFSKANDLTAASGQMDNLYKFFQMCEEIARKGS